VRLSGAICGGASFTTAFTLPAGFRPSSTLFLVAYSANATEAGLKIDTDGSVTPFNGAGNGNVSNYTGLDGISFPTTS
jgi:hypothetical protein